MLQENLNLDKILEKKEAKSDTFILVASPSGIKYNIPRSHIEHKIGNELMLDISFKDLQRHRDKIHDFLFSIMTYRKQAMLAMTVVSLISLGMIFLILLSTIHQSFAQTAEGKNATSARAPFQTAGPPRKPYDCL